MLTKNTAVQLLTNSTDATKASSYQEDVCSPELVHCNSSSLRAKNCELASQKTQGEGNWMKACFVSVFWLVKYDKWNLASVWCATWRSLHAISGIWCLMYNVGIAQSDKWNLASVWVCNMATSQYDKENLVFNVQCGDLSKRNLGSVKVNVQHGDLSMGNELAQVISDLGCYLCQCALVKLRTWNKSSMTNLACIAIHIWVVQVKFKPHVTWLKVC